MRRVDRHGQDRADFPRLPLDRPDLRVFRGHDLAHGHQQGPVSLDSPYSYVIYAAGFASGNYVGMLLEEALPFGHKSLRVITTKEISALPLALRSEGFGVTVTDGMGLRGPVTILYSIVPKKSVKKFIEIVTILEPHAFITIEEVRAYRSGFMSARKTFPDVFGRLITKKK